MSIHDDALAVLENEIAALSQLRERVNETFAQAVEILFHCPGRVVVTGVGKSGLIAHKIAATLASTGTHAYFMHAAEGSHGDLGMIMRNDVVVICSYSGEVRETIELIPSVRRIGARIIALTGRPQSTLGQHADLLLDIHVPREACPHNLAPTTSTTAMLVVGDMLAIALLKLRGFTEEDYALYHPGGALGRRLLVRVGDLMHSGEDNPIVTAGAPMAEVLTTLCEKALGAVNVVDEVGLLAGIFTDGDLKRCLQKHGDQLLHRTVREMMTCNPITLTIDTLAVKALALMENRPSQISVLPVTDAQGRAVGLLRLHDLIRAGIA